MKIIREINKIWGSRENAYYYQNWKVINDIPFRLNENIRPILINFKKSIIKKIMIFWC